MLAYCDDSLKVTIVQNFMKIVEITQFLRNNARHVSPILNIFTDLESRSQESFKLSYYTTMFNKLCRQGHFKVITSFDLDDLLTLKHSIFLLAIQGLEYILISDF